MRTFLLLVATSFFMVAPASANVVAPGAFEFVDAPDANCIPLTGCLDTDRYQQVYSASEFLGPIEISGIAFRLDATAGNISALPLSFTLSNVSLGLSTTSGGPDGLSATFADNRGADFTVVRSGSVTLASAYLGGLPVAPLDVLIEFDTHFAYDPSAGNLLFDWQNFGGETLAPVQFFDMVNSSGDSTSRVRAFDVNATTGSLQTRGLVTMFVAAPEPSSFALLILGVVGLGWAHRRL